MVTLPLELLIRLSVVQSSLAVVDPGYKQEAVSDNQLYCRSPGAAE